MVSATLQRPFLFVLVVLSTCKRKDRAPVATQLTSRRRPGRDPFGNTSTVPPGHSLCKFCSFFPLLRFRLPCYFSPSRPMAFQSSRTPPSPRPKSPSHTHSLYSKKGTSLEWSVCRDVTTPATRRALHILRRWRMATRPLVGSPDTFRDPKGPVAFTRSQPFTSLQRQPPRVVRKL